jgi:hypothetical protein
MESARVAESARARFRPLNRELHTVVANRRLRKSNTLLYALSTHRAGSSCRSGAWQGSNQLCHLFKVNDRMGRNQRERAGRAPLRSLRKASTRPTPLDACGGSSHQPRRIAHLRWSADVVSGYAHSGLEVRSMGIYQRYTRHRYSVEVVADTVAFAAGLGTGLQLSRLR